VVRPRTANPNPKHKSLIVRRYNLIIYPFIALLTQQLALFLGKSWEDIIN